MRVEKQELGSETGRDGALHRVPMILQCCGQLGLRPVCPTPTPWNHWGTVLNTTHAHPAHTAEWSYPGVGALVSKLIQVSLKADPKMRISGQWVSRRWPQEAPAQVET